MSITYKEAKTLYLQGNSLRSIERQYGYNRKKLSVI